MQTFELNIFINRPQKEVYEHIAEPINMIGLQPLLTTIDILKEQKDTTGVVLRPFHTVQTFRWLGLPILRNRVYSVLHLTKPFSELEIHVFGRANTKIVFRYRLQETEESTTHLMQKVSFERVSKFLEGIVFEQSLKAQRVFLAEFESPFGEKLIIACTAHSNML